MKLSFHTRIEQDLQDCSPPIMGGLLMDSVDGEAHLLNGGDVVQMRLVIRHLTEVNGFSLLKQTKLVTAASELARNSVKYAKDGVVRWRVLSECDRRGLSLIFEDQGPGIANLDLALTDGWSSGGGLGLGLPGTRRLVDELRLESQPNIGTRVTITMWR